MAPANADVRTHSLPLSMEAAHGPVNELAHKEITLLARSAMDWPASFDSAVALVAGGLESPAGVAANWCDICRALNVPVHAHSAINGFAFASAFAQVVGGAVY